VGYPSDNLALPRREKEEHPSDTPAGIKVTQFNEECIEIRTSKTRPGGVRYEPHLARRLYVTTRTRSVCFDRGRGYY